MGLEQINVIRKSKGITLDELVRLSGVPKGTLAKITSGITKAPSLDTIQAIAKALNCSLDDFDDGSIKRFNYHLESDEKEHIEKYRALDSHGKELTYLVLNAEYTRCTTPAPKPIPILLPEAVEEDERPIYNVTPVRRSIYKASAGRGTYLGPEAFEIINVQDNELTSRASFVVPVSGDSMEPLYGDGDVLIVENCEELEPGEIGVFTLNGQAYVKKLGNGQLISLNPAYDPIPMDESILLNGRVIGVMEPDWIVG